MIHYSKGRVPRQAHVSIPEGLFEEEHGRNGFAGRVSQFYHLHPPTEWTRIEGPLRPRGINSYALNPSDSRDPKGEPLRVFYNENVAISISRRSAAMPYCFRNGDGDELHFIHKGNGLLRSDYGPLRYEEGDYIAIPKGTSYQIVPDQSENLSPSRHAAKWSFPTVAISAITRPSIMGLSKPRSPSRARTTDTNGNCG